MNSPSTRLFRLLLWGILIPILGLQTFGEEQQRRPGDVVCGPRCVQFLLRYHGISGDLIELIQEIQWPAFESGTSLAQVNAALKRRGVNTQLVSVPKDSEYVWPHPSIVHIPDPKGDLGHFAVVLPSRKLHEVRLWLGVGGVRALKIEQFHRMHSDVALVTLQPPDSDGTVAFVRSRNVLWCSLTGVVSLATISLVWFECHRERIVRSGFVPAEKITS